MVVVGEYTCYPIVEILKSVSHRCVIPRLDQIFSMFSIPEVVKTDNGHPFLRDKFRQFPSYLGFHHHKITPHWLKANAEAECFMKTLSKFIRAEVTDNVNWRQKYRFSCVIIKQCLIAGLDQLQLSYCATDHFEQNFHRHHNKDLTRMLK